VLHDLAVTGSGDCADFFDPFEISFCMSDCAALNSCRFF